MKVKFILLFLRNAFSVSSIDFDKVSAKIITSGAEIFRENISPGDSLYFLDPDGHKLEIHVGNCQDRIDTKKKDVGHWKNVVWDI